jgi:hypothetical protein
VVVGLIAVLAALTWFRVARRNRRLDQAYGRAGFTLVSAHGGTRVYAGEIGTRELLIELVAIGRGRGFLTSGGKDPRTREIGEDLNRINGKQAMLEAHATVEAELGRLKGRELEMAWNGIGSWMG